MASRLLVLTLYPDTPFSDISSTISQSLWADTYSRQAILCMGISSWSTCPTVDTRYRKSLFSSIHPLDPVFISMRSTSVIASSSGFSAKIILTSQAGWRDNFPVFSIDSGSFPTTVLPLIRLSIKLFLAILDIRSSCSFVISCPPSEELCPHYPMEVNKPFERRMDQIFFI